MHNTDIVIYTTKFCPYCIRAKHVLNKKQSPFTEISVDGNAELRAEMTAKAGSHTVPQIWINEQHIGGCDELLALEYAGKLDALLGVAP